MFQKKDNVSPGIAVIFEICAAFVEISPQTFFFNQVKQLQEYCAPIKFSDLMKSKNRELVRAAMYMEV